MLRFAFGLLLAQGQGRGSASPRGYARPPCGAQNGLRSCAHSCIVLDPPPPPLPARADDCSAIGT